MVSVSPATGLQAYRPAWALDGRIREPPQCLSGTIGQRARSASGVRRGVEMSRWRDRDTTHKSETAARVHLDSNFHLGATSCGSESTPQLSMFGGV